VSCFKIKAMYCTSEVITLNQKDQIRQLILNSQAGVIKEYNYSDLNLYALDERQKIKSGIDVFGAFAATLPQMLTELKKVNVRSRENKIMGKKEMQAYCYILSQAEVNEILSFIDSCACVRTEQDKIDEAKDHFHDKFKIKTHG